MNVYEEGPIGNDVCAESITHTDVRVSFVLLASLVVHLLGVHILGMSI